MYKMNYRWPPTIPSMIIVYRGSALYVIRLGNLLFRNFRVESYPFIRYTDLYFPTFP